MGRLRPGARPLLRASLAGLLLLGCASAPEPGVMHVVREGENLFRIARHYGVAVSDILEANEVGDVRDIHNASKRYTLLICLLHQAQDRLLHVEDTRYSDTPELERDSMRREVRPKPARRFSWGSPKGLC